MRHIGYLGLSLLVILALAAPSFAQADADAYRTFYNIPATEGQKKIDAGEKFLNDFKESQWRQPIFTTILNTYVNVQNWAKAMEVADRLPTVLPAADAATKVKFYQVGLAAAQQSNNANKLVEFGDKLLAVDPTNLNAQVMLAATLPVTAPKDKAAQDKSIDLATKALAGVAQYFTQPKPAGMTDAQWKQSRTDLEDQLHTALAMVYYNRSDWQKSIDEFGTVIKSSPKDGPAHYYLGLIYRSQTVDASQQYQAALKAENDAKQAKPIDQPLVDELAAKTQGLVEALRINRDKAIDELATSVALGGVVAQQARPVLEALYKGKNNDSLEGLDQLINSKK